MGLAGFLGSLAPDERKALAAIVETADLIQVEGVAPYLLVPAPEWLLDTLAVFGECQEREPALEDEPDDEGETDQDLEPSLGEYGGIVDGEPERKRLLQ